MSDTSKLPTNFSDLLKKTAFLEDRIARLEKVLELKPLEMVEALPAGPGSKTSSPKVGLELQIGQYWSVKICVTLLLLGTIFSLSLFCRKKWHNKF